MVGASSCRLKSRGFDSRSQQVQSCETGSPSLSLPSSLPPFLTKGDGNTDVVSFASCLEDSSLVYVEFPPQGPRTLSGPSRVLHLLRPCGGRRAGRLGCSDFQPPPHPPPPPLLGAGRVSKCSRAPLTDKLVPSRPCEACQGTRQAAFPFSSVTIWALQPTPHAGPPREKRSVLSSRSGSPVPTAPSPGAQAHLRARRPDRPAGQGAGGAGPRAGTPTLPWPRELRGTADSGWSRQRILPGGPTASGTWS